MKWMLSGMVVAMAATFALSAWARPGGYGPGMHGMEGPGMVMGGGRGMDRMLDGLNASEAQRSQIRQIFKAAGDDLRGQREQRRALHERSLQIFAAPTIDAAAAEQVRQQEQALHEQASKRRLQAMLDASSVLTPEQRAKLAERVKQREEIRRERFERMQQRAQRERPRQ
ncbi:Spy/CpxP family protein refolding chaperone [Piscinibacter sp.]|uniref:Spy/CpxP family protein refolding chaperone n=1 Tax=Piscinibacter sp. TaxID=1903157 RepID=UPI0039E4F85A